MFEKLTNVQAYMLMMKIIKRAYGYYSDVNRIEEFIADFCAIENGYLESESSPLISHYNNLIYKRYLQIKINCLPQGSNPKFNIKVFTSLYKANIYLTKNNMSFVVYLPFRVKNMPNEKVNINITRCVGSSKICILPKFDLIKNVTIPFERIEVLHGYTTKIMLNNANFIFNVNYVLNDPFLFNTANSFIDKRFSDTKYICDFEEHFKLVYFIKTQEHDNTKKLLIHEMSKIIFNEHLFQNSLPYSDHKLCVKLVKKFINNELTDLHLIKNRLLEKKVFYETKDNDKLYEYDILKSVIKLLPDKKEAENGLNEEMEIEFEKNPIKICEQRLKEWIIEDNAKFKMRKLFIRPFNEDMIENLFIDDFDLISEEVCIWSSRSIFGIPSFARVNTLKSLDIFSLKNPLRQFAIFLYSNLVYRMALNFFAVLQLVINSSSIPFINNKSLDDYNLLFLLIFTFDLILASIAKGFFANEYSYLSEIWNVVDTVGTFYLWIERLNILPPLTFLKNIRSETPMIISDYERGIKEFFQLVRVIRLVRDLRNIVFLKELRIIIRTLLTLVPKTAPMLLVIFFILNSISILLVRAYSKFDHRICWPRSLSEKDLIKTEHAVQIKDNAYLENVSKIFDFESSFPFHPCGIINNLPLSHVCASSEICLIVSNEFQMRFGIFYKNSLTFKSLPKTWLLLLEMITQENFDEINYRLQFEIGIFNFIVNSFIQFFGLFAMSLFLAIISNTYFKEIDQRRLISVKNISFHDGEAEFTHNIINTSVILYEDVTKLEDSGKIYGHKWLSTSKTFKSDKLTYDSTMFSYEEEAYRRYLESKDEKPQISIFDTYVGMNLIDTIFEYFIRFNRSDVYKHMITIVMILHASSFVLLKSGIFSSTEFFTRDILSQIEASITVFYVIEMLINLICYGRSYLKYFWHLFDLFIIFCNILQQFDISELYILTCLRFFRIFRILTQSWTTLATLAMGIFNSFSVFFTTITVFMAIYIYMTLFAYKLLGSLNVAVEENLLEVRIAYGKFKDAVYSVFTQMFISSWPESYFYYEDLLERGHKFYECFPFIVPLFIFVGYFFNLIFQDLFIPQLVSNNAINQILGEEEEFDFESAYLQNKPKHWLKKSPLSTLRIVSFLAKTIMISKEKSGSVFNRLWKSLYRNGSLRFKSISKSSAVYWGTILLNVWDIFYIIGDDHIITTKPSSYNCYLLLGLIIKSGLLFEIIVRALGLGFGEYFYGKNSKNVSYMLLTSTIDIVSLGTSFIAFPINFYFGQNYHSKTYLFYFEYLGCFRLIWFCKPLKIRAINILKHRKGIFNVMLFYGFIVLLCSIIGVLMFENKMNSCLQTKTGWKSSYVALNDTHCQLINSQIQYFTFENVIEGCFSVMQMFYGEDIWTTVGLLTNFTGFNTSSDTLNIPSAWAFITFVILAGYLLDGLIFSGINRIVSLEDTYDNKSVWTYLKDDKSKSTYLALECVKFVPPWFAVEKPLKLRWLLFKIISNTFYNDCIIFIIGINIISSMIEIIIGKHFLPEKTFLTFYLLDGIARFLIVGIKYIKYPLLLLLDIVLPLTLMLLFAFDLRIGTINWSLLIILRFIAPERYLKSKFWSAPKMILSSIVSSSKDQIFMIVYFIILLFIYAKIGCILFNYTDSYGSEYRPISMPLNHLSIYKSFTHLFSLAFSQFFDLTIIHLIIRSNYCNKNVSPQHEQNKINRYIRKYISNLDVYIFVDCKNLTINSILVDKYLDIIESNLNNNYDLNDIAKSNKLLLINREYFYKNIDINRTYYNTFNDYQNYLNLILYIRNTSNNMPTVYDDEIDDLELFIHRRFCRNTYDDFKFMKNFKQHISTTIINSLYFYDNENKGKFHAKCAPPYQIRFYYFFYLIFAKLLILNLLKSIVLKHYVREYIRFTIDFSPDDIADYVDKWRRFARSMGNYSSYMPLKYAYFFIRQIAPPKVRIRGAFEEQIQLLFVKYHLPLREEDMYVHAFDLFIIAVAANFECDPNLDLISIAHSLEYYIRLIFPDYVTKNRKTIPMSSFIRGYYFGCVILNATLNRIVRNSLLITATYDGHFFDYDFDRNRQTSIKKNIAKSKKTTKSKTKTPTSHGISFTHTFDKMMENDTLRPFSLKIEKPPTTQDTKNDYNNVKNIKMNNNNNAQRKRLYNNKNEVTIVEQQDDNDNTQNYQSFDDEDDDIDNSDIHLKKLNGNKHNEFTIDHQVDDKSSDDQSSDDKSSDDKSSDDKSSDDKSSDDKSFDNKSIGDKNTDYKSSDIKSTDDKSSDDQSSYKSSDDKSSDDKSSDDKSSDDKSSDDKSSDDKSSDDKSSDDKSSEDKSFDNKSIGDKNTDYKSSDIKSTDDKSSDDQSSYKSSDDKSSDDKSSDDKSSDDKSSDIKSTDDKSSDEKSSEDKGTDDQSSYKNSDDKNTDKSTNKTTDYKSPDDKNTDDKSFSIKSSDDKSSDDQSSYKSSDDQSTGDKNTDDKSSDEKSSEDKGSDDQSSDEQSSYEHYRTDININIV